jgi:hypothetical protein
MSIGIRRSLSRPVVSPIASGPPGYAAMTFKTMNLGDDIQSLAAMRLLPRIDLWVDRDRSQNVSSNAEKSKIIMNGWYGGGLAQWPPSPQLIPLLVSIHVAQGYREADLLANEAAVQFYHQFGPVGCRDLQTVEFLRNLGVEAYFSGCLTLALEIPRAKKTVEHALLVDVAYDEQPDVRSECHQYLMRLLAASKMKYIGFSHGLDPSLSPIQRMMRARQALGLFSSASFVITSRLHCALPCLALGVPVLFVRPRYGTGRLGGLVELTRNCSVEELLEADSEQILSASPNPKLHIPIADELKRTCRGFLSS